MSEYKEQTLVGKQWTRGCRVIIDNPRNMTPTISIFEEKVISLEDEQEVVTSIGSFAQNFDPKEVFQLYDSETNLPVDGETFTAELLYKYLYSYYINKAVERDSKM